MGGDRIVLIIGGGIAGITAALELAEMRIPSTIIERENRLGGQAGVFACKASEKCNKCFACRHLAVCWGGCLKDRMPFDSKKLTCESYFCEGYIKVFDYSLPRFIKIADKFHSGSLIRPNRLD